MKKLWHLSDSHCMADRLTIPENIDLIVHSGDATNSRDPYTNEKEMWKFIEWYGKISIANKIYCAGNHDTSIQQRLIRRKNFSDNGIIYLEDESFEVEGIKIWSSPWTPTFGTGWAFNRDRAKMHDLYESIPSDTDIVVTHGPPMGILDYSYSREGVLERCGCKSLRRHMFNLKPKLHLFGHIHDCDDLFNAGTQKIADLPTIFSNGAVVTDRKFDMGPSSNGNILNL